MQLPGGWWENGRRRRDFSFRGVNGALELALNEAVESAASWPQAVTLALTAALDQLGGRSADPAAVAGLCVADRHFLLRRLQIHLGEAELWRQGVCTACGAAFDFHVSLEALPVAEAGGEFPFATLRRENRVLRFRLPTGADQEVVAGRDDEDGARRELLRRCWVAEGESDQNADAAFAAAAWEQIEAALEEVSPAVITEAAAACPQCGAENRVELDPTDLLRRGTDPLLREVHQLALHYHWSEADILELQRPRRRRYLHLIDQARGFSG